MQILKSDENTNSVTPLLHTKIQASAMLSVSVRTIDNLIAAKELPVRRIRGRVLIPRSALVNLAKPNYKKAA